MTDRQTRQTPKTKGHCRDCSDSEIGLKGPPMRLIGYEADQPTYQCPQCGRKRS